MVGSVNFFFNGLAHADPELVCDENDEPIGIRLNLPEPIVKKIKEYIGEDPLNIKEPSGCYKDYERCYDEISRVMKKIKDNLEKNNI